MGECTAKRMRWDKDESCSDSSWANGKWHKDFVSLAWIAKDNTGMQTAGLGPSPPLLIHPL